MPSQQKKSLFEKISRAARLISSALLLVLGILFLFAAGLVLMSSPNDWMFAIKYTASSIALLAFSAFTAMNLRIAIISCAVLFALYLAYAITASMGTSIYLGTLGLLVLLVVSAFGTEN